MKYFFHAVLLVCFAATVANSNLTTKPAKNNATTKATSCNVNNNNYNSFYAGPNCKKIEGMFSEVKQELAEMKQEIRGIKENQTGGLAEKAINSTKNASKCDVINCNGFLANHTKGIENMFSEVKQQLAELKDEIKDIRENQTGGARARVYKNCAEIYQSGGNISGVYKIEPDGLGEFEVFCDQKTAGGGWTVFQKRRDGSVDFFRAWDDYKRGFGNLNGEFWLGLDKIHRLTTQCPTVSISYKLRVDLEDIHGKTAFAEYSSFSVASERAKYKLSLGRYSEGTAGDSFYYHHGAAFTTKDRDNDANSDNCASTYKGAWWYKSCHWSNLNGLYLSGNSDSGGMCWYQWKKYESVKKSEMKIRPKDF